MDVKPSRLTYIDGLRGIAASAVVIQHIAERIILNDPSGADHLKSIFVESLNFGRFGVALFFLISGFVVPFSFRQPHALTRFLISRFFRLYPAYWASLGLAVFVLSYFADVHFGYFTLFANITMAQTALGQPGVIGPYWTLIIELAFYFMCAALFVLKKLDDWRTLIAAWSGLLALSIALSIFGVLTQHYVSANLPLNISLMFLGAIFRRAHIERDPRLRPLATPIVAASAILIGIVLMIAPDRGQELYTMRGFLLGYFAALGLFVFVVHRARASAAALTFLGTVSYSLYLFHDICLTALEHSMHIEGAASQAVFALAAIASSLAAAIAFCFGVEKPAIKLGRSVIRRSLALRPATPVAAGDKAAV